MKKSLLLLLSFIISLGAASQECNPYFNFITGQRLELTTYDNKDNIQMVATHDVIKSEATSSGGLKAEFKTRLTDKKGKEINTGAYTIFCEDGVYKVDIGSMVNQDFLKGYESMELEVEGNAFDLPGKLTEGQKLNDIEAKINIKSGGTKLFTMTVTFTDRVIDGFEKVTTPAGEFDCVVLSYTSQSKLGFVKSKILTKDYYAKGYGLVLSIVSNKKGKVQNKTKLTGIMLP